MKYIKTTVGPEWTSVPCLMQDDIAGIAAILCPQGSSAAPPKRRSSRGPPEDLDARAPSVEGFFVAFDLGNAIFGGSFAMVAGTPDLFMIP